MVIAHVLLGQKEDSSRGSVIVLEFNLSSISDVAC